MYWFDVQEALATKPDLFYQCVDELYERQREEKPDFEDITEVDDWDNNHNWSRARKEENRIRLERHEAGFICSWKPEQAEDRHDLLRSVFPGNPSQAATPKKVKKVKVITD